MTSLANRLAQRSTVRPAMQWVRVWLVTMTVASAASAQQTTTNSAAPQGPRAVEQPAGRVESPGADPALRDAQGDQSKQSGIETASTHPAAATPSDISNELRQLQDVLSARGWLLWRDSSGNTFLAPRPPPSAPAPATGVNVATGETRDADLHRLQSLLGSENWRVARDLAGNVLLFPMASRHDAFPVHETAAQLPPQQPASRAEDTPAAAANFERARELLAGYGWNLGRDDAGNLILEPLAGRPLWRDPETATVLGVEDAKALLATRGWNLATDASGNWLLTPRGAGKPQRDSLTAAGQRGARVSGMFLDPVATGGLTPPVDTNGEAAALAKAWLEQSGETGLTVGAVRRIHQVFLVSIVTEDRPHQLRNQLAIRMEDGLLVPLLGH